MRRQSCWIGDFLAPFYVTRSKKSASGPPCCRLPARFSNGCARPRPTPVGSVLSRDACVQGNEATTTYPLGQPRRLYTPPPLRPGMDATKLLWPRESNRALLLLPASLEYEVLKIEHKSAPSGQCSSTMMLTRLEVRSRCTHRHQRTEFAG
jgi:hypothetical protein